MQVVACTPAQTGKNWCVAGCQDGSVWLWDLDAKADEKPMKIDGAHGKDTSITALAFSPDGAWFATGASDGSIRLWSAETGVEEYPSMPPMAS